MKQIEQQLLIAGVVVTLLIRMSSGAHIKEEFEDL